MIKTALINSDKDIHVCGICQNIYDDINKFLNHKVKCPLKRKHITISKQDSDKQKSLLRNTNKRELAIRNNDLKTLSQNTRDNQILDNQPATHEAPIEKPVQLVDGSLKRSHFNTVTKEINEDGKTTKDLLTACPNKNSKAKKLGPLKKPSKTRKKSIKDKTKNRCEICDFKGKYRRDLIRHMRKHTGDKPYTCQYCDKKFSRQDKHAIHERIHRGERPFKCNECEYSGSDSCALRLHQLTHSGERRHRCQMCPYKARSASHLSVHLRIHTGDSPYFCCSDSCGRLFKNSSDLSRHMKSHQPDAYSLFKGSCKKYTILYDSEEGLRNRKKTCHICQDYINIREFPSRKRGRKMRHTHCTKSHECPHCDAKFVRQDSLRCHIKLHNTLPLELANKKEDICIDETDCATPGRDLLHEESNELNLSLCQNDLLIPLETLMQCAIDTSAL